MNVITTLLVGLLLTLLSNFLVSLVPIKAESSLPPLDESKVQVHWMEEGEPAPFDGILLNEYTYNRLRLKALEND